MFHWAKYGKMMMNYMGFGRNIRDLTIKNGDLTD